MSSRSDSTPQAGVSTGAPSDGHKDPVHSPDGVCRIKGPYDPSRPVTIIFKKRSRTKRSFQAECDINTLMAKYEQTGILDHVRSTPGQYGDVSDLPDYQSALNFLMEAQGSFDALPARLRKHFDNDPGTFLDFVNDPSNREEAIELGLIQRERVPSSPPPSEDPSPAPAPAQGAPEVAPKEPQ